MGTPIHALDKRLKERERRDRFGWARPLNLLIITLCGFASFCLHPCPFCSRLGSCTLATLAPCILALYVCMQRQKKQANRQAKK